MRPGLSRNGSHVRPCDVIVASIVHEPFARLTNPKPDAEPLTFGEAARKMPGCPLAASV